jgi:hypothetical protein
VSLQCSPKDFRARRPGVRRRRVAAQGERRPEFVNRAKGMGFDYAAEEFLDVFWDLFAAGGNPIRAAMFRDGPPMVSNGSNAAGNLGDAVVRGASGGVIRR